jgi:hypothetical protein
MLPAVGAFFTGPGDPRPILRALDAGLRKLGPPARDHGPWRLALRARGQELAVIDEQDRAALAGDVPAFVQSVHRSAANFRQIAHRDRVWRHPLPALSNRRGPEEKYQNGPLFA